MHQIWLANLPSVLLHQKKPTKDFFNINSFLELSCCPLSSASFYVMRALLGIAILLGVGTMSICVPTPAGDYIADVIAAMNTSVNPCDDFYNYACGGWIAANPLPSDAPAIFKAFNEIGDANYLIKQAILANSTGTPMGIFYASCMNTNYTNARGSEPLDAYLALIDNIQSYSDFMDSSRASALVRSCRLVQARMQRTLPSISHNSAKVA